MDRGTRPLTSDDLHPEYLDRSIKELQRMVREHEEKLERLREAPVNVPQDAASSTKASLDIMNKGYGEAASLEPFLPFPDSVLPALLAMRKTHDIITESHAYLASQKVSLASAKKRLETEQANLSDQKLLQQALEARLEALRSGRETRMEMTPEQIAKEKLAELKQKKQSYDKDTQALMKKLKKFIHEQLGAMLAAEELGGPVVGDMIEVESDQLAAGFSSQGRPKKAKANASEDKRQRRIDEIWGAGDGNANAAEDDEERDEAAAAAAEMQELTEKLLNGLMESQGDFMDIPRESAAARFLVRSKVAMFHPMNARQMRLVDFGREIDA